MVNKAESKAVIQSNLDHLVTAIQLRYVVTAISRVTTMKNKCKSFLQIWGMHPGN